MTQLSFAAVAYNASLSFYYVATLKWGVTAEDFAAKYEAFIHGLIVFVFLFTATAGVPLNMYREMKLGEITTVYSVGCGQACFSTNVPSLSIFHRKGMGCWIADVPKGCWTDGGCVGPTIEWLYGGLLLMLTIVSLPINYLLIYCHVKRSLHVGGARSRAQQVQIHRLGMQCFLYVAGFYVAFTPQLMIRILGSSYGYDFSRESEIYGLLVVDSIVFPLQGR